LFIGLSFMKTAMEAHKIFDFSHYATMSLAVYLLIGFMITVVVQSSSVTMALHWVLFMLVLYPCLSLPQLYWGQTGTTIKIMLGAIGGNVSKKRIVLGNFLSISSLPFLLTSLTPHTIADYRLFISVILSLLWSFSPQ
jgi:phosphate:Na+ symporter